ncbi:MAG: adenine phosphoribosyltransferase [Clostridiales bacterium GWF2_36_10]|nr:MAG: adenine phosphoribosyltransferase [Clostridiales bacterium GWF2_36_10]HAN21362.1 adenine phosphoribosyltransferase [Clostridiales bacterium]
MNINPVEYKEYPLEVAGVKRNLPICKVNDNLYIAAFVIFGDVELTKACATELVKMLPEHDVLITAEAKGIPLIYEMARQINAKRYLIARKSPKLYMKNPSAVEVQSITTSKIQTLYIDKDDADYMREKRVVIVDDVISTGESAMAVEKLVTESGGVVAGRMAILAEGDASDRKDIIYLEKLPLFFTNGTIPTKS